MSYYNLISTRNTEIHNSISFTVDTRTSPPCYISYSLCENLSKFKKQIEKIMRQPGNKQTFKHSKDFKTSKI